MTALPLALPVTQTNKTPMTWTFAGSGLELVTTVQVIEVVS